MFDKTGAKLRGVAVIFFVLGCIGVFVLAIVLSKDGYHDYDGYHDTFNVLKFLGIWLGGTVLVYIDSLFLHGFGVLVDSSEKNAASSERMAQLLSGLKEGEPKPKSTAAKSPEPRVPSVQANRTQTGASDEETFRCPECGEIQRKGRKRCWRCGVTFAETDGE